MSEANEEITEKEEIGLAILALQGANHCLKTELFSEEPKHGPFFFLELRFRLKLVIIDFGKNFEEAAPPV